MYALCMELACKSQEDVGNPVAGMSWEQKLGPLEEIRCLAIFPINISQFIDMLLTLHSRLHGGMQELCY